MQVSINNIGDPIDGRTFYPDAVQYDSSTGTHHCCLVRCNLHQIQPRHLHSSVIDKTPGSYRFRWLGHHLYLDEYTCRIRGCYAFTWLRRYSEVLSNISTRVSAHPVWLQNLVMHYVCNLLHHSQI